MERRPVVIATIVSFGFLALLTAEAVREMFAVPPMPDNMECVIDRNCPIVDYIPAPPLIAPGPSDVKRLPRPAKPRYGKSGKTAHP
ncbi:MAG TPA: hypothetical protein VN428_20265 [Bryobacteraceae bacterium]|nr:hypothetical protein [Bryobacteraceae bacterium]